MVRKLVLGLVGLGLLVVGAGVVFWPEDERSGNPAQVQEYSTDTWVVVSPTLLVALGVAAISIVIAAWVVRRRRAPR